MMHIILRFEGDFPSTEDLNRYLELYNFDDSTSDDVHLKR